MTNRARVLVIVGLIGLYSGSIRSQAMLSLMSLSALLWVLFEGLRLQAWVRTELPRIRCRRLVNGRVNSSGLLWAGRKLRVELSVHSYAEVRPVIQVRDVASAILEVHRPAAGEPSHPRSARQRESTPDHARAVNLLSRLKRRLAAVGGAAQARNEGIPNEWTLRPGSRKRGFSYSGTVRAAGKLTFPGVRLTVHDPFHFFELNRFVELRQSFRVLPDYLQSGKQRPTVKRYNSLPRHGIHRLQRSGAGSELLDLRDYVPGDPPKSIAWKVSARRGKLITHEYESEVPVRVRLFVDGSIATRIGDYGTRLLDQINSAAASVAKAALTVGDPVTGTLIDERGAKQLQWLSGDRGFLLLLEALADFSSHRPPTTDDLSPFLMRRALSVCHERFPELLAASYHRRPFTIWPSRRVRWRLAGVLTETLSLSPTQQIACLHDNQTLAHYLQEFLYRAGTPWMPPLRSVAASAMTMNDQSMSLLRESMCRAIAHARDNEVFVVFADPVSCARGLAQLVRVVTLAAAKHHRVVFICPTVTWQRPDSEPIRPRSESVHDLVQASEQTRVRELSTQMKRELARLGVAVSFSGEQEAMRIVLAETDLARDGKTRRQSAGL